MVVVLRAEVFQGGENGIGRRLAQPAEGRDFHLGREVLELRDVLLFALALRDPA